MELVHGGPHYIIAATHTTEASDKFWVSQPDQPNLEIEKDAIRPRSKYPHSRVFKEDAPWAHVNTQWWALQELVSSWSMIIFMEKPVYLACSNGSRCDRGGCKTSIWTVGFSSDPPLPRSAMQFTEDTEAVLYQFLYEYYSRRNFSRITNRRLSIAALEQRLIRGFKVDEGGFDVFEALEDQTQRPALFGGVSCGDEEIR